MVLRLDCILRRCHYCVLAIWVTRRDRRVSNFRTVNASYAKFIERDPDTLRHFALPRCGLGVLSCKEQQELNSGEERLLYENLWSRQPDTEVVNVS
jgi:hypothetical protein